MLYRIHPSERAELDIERALAYLSQFYPGTPIRFRSLLREILSNLKHNPYMYPVYEPNTKYRRAVVGSYILFYKINEERKYVNIFRVLRGSWDITEVSL